MSGVFQKFIKNNLYKRSFVSYCLYPASILYALVQKANRVKYSLFLPKTNSGKAKTICIGNILSGGTGKTPVTIGICRYLQSKNKNVAVCLRGYKSKLENSNTLISDNNKILPIAAKAGDEAKLLAVKLKGIPVAVGKSRQKSIELLIKNYPNLDYIVLDDSFQHLKIRHDFDIVVFNQTSGIGNGFVLPAGILREPVSSLKYANTILVNGSKLAPIKKYYNKTVFYTTVLNYFYDFNGNSIKPDILKQSKICLMSGIGFPDGFEKSVTKAGIKFVKHFKFPDHYDYNLDNLQRVSKFVSQNNINFVLTTEKDYAKLGKLTKIPFNLAIAELSINLDFSLFL